MGLLGVDTSGLDDGFGSIATDAAEGAGAGSILPGIGTIAGGIAGAASGVLGMIGGQNQNTANQEAQVQAEQFDDYMSSTAYQRATADMRAAGINPMLAYMQGGASSPSAPTYTATNTLDDFSSSAKDAGDLASKYQEMQGQDSDNQIKKVNASAAGPLKAAEIGTAQSTEKSAAAGVQTSRANAKKAQAAANVATATQQNDIETSSAQTAKAKAEAVQSQVDANVKKAGEWSQTTLAPVKPWMDAVHEAASTAKDGAEIFGIGKYIQNFGKKPVTTKTPLNMSQDDLEDMMNQYSKWKAGK